MAWNDKPPSEAELKATANTDWMKSAPTPEELGTVEETPGMGESALRGAANGATLGFEPQLVGALETAGDKLKGALNGEGTKEGLLDLYRKYRDLQYKKNDAAKTANPKTFLAGNLAGGLATSFVPGLNVGASIEGAAGLGALAGLGNSRADLTTGDKDQYAQGLKDSLIGAGTGLALKPVGDYLSSKFAGTATPALDNIADTSQRHAGDHALKALGITRAQMQQELNEGGNLLGDAEYRSGLGQEALNHLKWKGGIEGVRDSIVHSLKDNLEQKQDILKQASQGIKNLQANGEALEGVSPSLTKDLYNTVNGKLRQINMTEENKNAINNLRDNFTGLAKQWGRNENNPIFLDKVKSQLGTDIGNKAFATADRELNYSPVLKKEMYGVLKNRVEDLAEAAQPGLKDQLIGTNNDIGNLIGLTKLGLQAHAKNSVANNHLGNVLAYTAGKYAGEGNPLVGLAAVGAKKAGEAFTGYDLRQLLSLAAAKGAQNTASMARKGASMLDQLPNYNGINNLLPASLQLSKGLSNVTSPVLGTVADKLNESGFEHMGNALHNAIQSGNEQQKNALIYSISSNPQAKKAIMGDDDESEVK